MKKLLLTLVITIPLLAVSQGYHIPSATLKTLDERGSELSDLFADQGTVMLFFFNETSSEIVENFEYLSDLQRNRDFNEKTRIVAIYNASQGNQANINPFIYGNNIEIETLVDINGAFQRAMGVSAETAIVIFNNENNYSDRFLGNMACSGELISLVNAMNTTSVGICDLCADNTWSGSSILNK